MANDKIEDVIRKVVLGESFMAEEQDAVPGPGDDEDTIEDGDDEFFEEEVVDDEEVIDEEVLDEAKDEDEDEDEDEEEEEEEEDEDEDEEEEDEDEGKKGKGKMPAFLKSKFKKKMDEAASDYSDKKLYQTANGKGAEIPAPTGDASSKNMGTIKAKKSDAKAETKIPSVSMKKEDLDALFGGNELSEDFKEKAATIFEAHMNERFHAAQQELQEQYETLLEEHTAAVTEELIERIDDYLAYVVEEWMQENRLAVDKGLRTEIAEEFIGNLRNLFTESYISVPEDKTDLFDEAVEENTTLNAELSEQVQKNMTLSEEVEQLQCEIVFREIAEGLTDTEVEKLRRLAEDVEFDTVDQFAEKLGVLRENIESIGTVTEGSSTNNEEISESVEDASEELSPLMEAYLRSMSKSQV
jgi:uncharacterized protein CbrC (UPF0167 family)